VNAAAASSSIGEGPPRRPVLVVDDDRDIRETLEELLRDEGYEVVTARNGAEALAAVRRERPALVVLDLFMPVMDGVEFRRRQLADPEIADVPVIVISAAAALAERTAGMGAQAVLEKPIALDELLACVERFCT
jgi:CheY-like chemotaxis protein